jgi:hypothetical protein
LRWRWAPVIRRAAVPKGARRGQTVRAGQRPAPQISGRTRALRSLARCRSSTHACRKLASSQAKRRGDAPSARRSRPTPRPRSGSAILADQQQIGRGGVGPGFLLLWALDAKRIADSRRMRRAPASRSQASELGWRRSGFAGPSGRVGIVASRQALSVRVCGVFGVGRAPSSAARQGCHA